jgi:hypothetical protein
LRIAMPISARVFGGTDAFGNPRCGGAIVAALADQRDGGLADRAFGDLGGPW